MMQDYECAAFLQPIPARLRLRATQHGPHCRIVVALNLIVAERPQELVLLVAFGANKNVHGVEVERDKLAAVQKHVLV